MLHPLLWQWGTQPAVQVKNTAAVLCQLLRRCGMKRHSYPDPAPMQKGRVLHLHCHQVDGVVAPGASFGSPKLGAQSWLPKLAGLDWLMMMGHEGYLCNPLFSFSHCDSGGLCQNWGQWRYDGVEAGKSSVHFQLAVCSPRWKAEVRLESER